MNIEITRQGNDYVVLPQGQSPLKFSNETELAAWLTSQPPTDTHPNGQPTPQPQPDKLPDPTETTPEDNSKPHNKPLHVNAPKAKK